MGAHRSVKQLFDLVGRTAVITGGSRGLGLQMAEALGEMGARIAISARKKDELDEAVAHLKGLGIAATAYPCDLGKREQVEPLAAHHTTQHARTSLRAQSPVCALFVGFRPLRSVRAIKAQ